MSNLFKTLILFFIAILILSPICIAATVSFSAINNSSDYISSMSYSNNDIYVADSSNIEITDNINGNAFVYGQNITIKSQIQGDLFIAGQSITIDESANIVGNVFAFANTITLKGKARDAYVFAQSFTLEKTASILRDFRGYAANINLEGSIQRNAYILAGNITINNSESAVILGNLEYTASQEFDIPKSAVSGEIKFTQEVSNEPTVAQLISAYITSFVNVLIYSLAVVLVILFLGSKFANKATYCMQKKSIITAGVGILAFITIPMLSILLIALGYTMYIGVALLAIYALILSITIAILGISIGNFIVNKLKNKSNAKTILFSLASVAVIWLLQKIPFIGNWISIFTVVFGLGIFVYSLFIRKDISSELENAKN